MKKTFLFLLLTFIFVNCFSQFDDTTFYSKYPGIYGVQQPRIWSTKVMRPPADTIYSKFGIVVKSGVLYIGNGIKWSAVTGGGGSSVDTTSLSDRINTMWSKVGNVGTDQSSNFIGTTDNQSLVMKSNNKEILRLRPDGTMIGRYFGQTVFEVNPATGSYILGDYEGSGSNTFIEINDANQRVNVSNILNLNSPPNTGSTSRHILLRNQSNGDVETIPFDSLYYWGKSGNASTDPSVNFLGTTDNKNLLFKVNNIQSGLIDKTFNNASFGYQSLSNNVNGVYNSSFGDASMINNTSGSYNTGIGRQSLFTNQDGSRNTAVGYQSLYSANSLTAEGNVAIGFQSLYSSTTASDNVAVGQNTLKYNTTAVGNVAIGSSALNLNDVYSYNTAVGYISQGLSTAAFNTSVGAYSLANNLTGEQNTAVGVNSLIANTTGIKNQGFGAGSLEANTIGSFNSGIGHDALLQNTTGSENVGLGWLGWAQNRTGSGNVGLGNSTGRSIFNGNYNFFGGHNAGYGSGQKDTVDFCIGLGYNAKTSRSYQFAVSDSAKSFTFRGISAGVAGYVLKDSLGNGEYWVARPDETIPYPGAGIPVSTGSAWGTSRVVSGGSGISITNGDGVSGNPTVAVNINGTSSDTVTVDDEFLFSDINNSNAIRKVSFQDFLKIYNKEFSRRYAYNYFGEFTGGTIGTTISPNDVAAQNSGTGASTSGANTGIANRPGAVTSSTGATATGRSGISSSLASFFFGGGTWVYETAVKIATLSDGTNRYQLMIGFVDNFSSANQIDAVYFLYDEGGVTTGSAASANWQIVTSNSSTRTFTTTSTAVAAASWITLRIEVNAAGTRADFFINGSNVGNTTTNIPSSAGRECGFGWGIMKSIGTTARTVSVDYLMVQNIFTTPR